MRRSRRLGPAFSLALLAAWGCLSSCATTPTKATEPAEATPKSAASGKIPAAAKKPDSAALPEISLPYRRPTRSPLIVASLHEPALPAAKPATATTVATLPPKAEAPIVAAAPIAAPAATAVPAASPAPASATTAPKATPPKAAVPKATVAPKAAPPKTPAKPDLKPNASEVKNAPSTASLAVVADPSSEKKPDIARNFPAVVGTRFEIPFQGTGWTYLGEQTLKEGIAYDSRRFDATSLVFLLNPTKAGDYILRFQKQDSLRGLAYEELVGVSVAPKPAAAAASASVAPASPSAVPTSASAAPASASAAPASASVVSPSASAAPASPAAAPAGASALPAGASALPASPAAAAAKSAPPLVDASTLATPEAALLSARSELDAGRVPGALAALDRLIALAPAGTDEAYILYARALEKNGAQKDIKRAYAYYKKLRDEYPESPFWDEASARASYIERRYFDIR
jgi:hypothetical protein